MISACTAFGHSSSGCVRKFSPSSNLNVSIFIHSTYWNKYFKITHNAVSMISVWTLHLILHAHANTAPRQAPSNLRRPIPLTSKHGLSSLGPDILSRLCSNNNPHNTLNSKVWTLYWTFFNVLHQIVCWSLFLFKSSIATSFYFVDAENLTKFVVTKFSCFVFWKLTEPFNAMNTPDFKTNEAPMTKNVTFITISN